MSGNKSRFSRKPISITITDEMAHDVATKVHILALKDMKINVGGTRFSMSKKPAKKITSPAMFNDEFQIQVAGKLYQTLIAAEGKESLFNRVNQGASLFIKYVKEIILDSFEDDNVIGPQTSGPAAKKNGKASPPTQREVAEVKSVEAESKPEVAEIKPGVAEIKPEEVTAEVVESKAGVSANEIYETKKLESSIYNALQNSAIGPYVDAEHLAGDKMFGCVYCEAEYTTKNKLREHYKKPCVEQSVIDRLKVADFNALPTPFENSSEVEGFLTGLRNIYIDCCYLNPTSSDRNHDFNHVERLNNAMSDLVCRYLKYYFYRLHINTLNIYIPQQRPERPFHVIANGVWTKKNTIAILENRISILFKSMITFIEAEVGRLSIDQDKVRCNTIIRKMVPFFRGGDLNKRIAHDLHTVISAKQSKFQHIYDCSPQF